MNYSYTAKDLLELFIKYRSVLLDNDKNHSFFLSDEQRGVVIDALRAQCGPSLPQGQRNAIIEECAKVVSTLYQDHYDHSAHKSAAKDIAHAIRGLKRHDATQSPSKEG